MKYLFILILLITSLYSCTEANNTPKSNMISVSIEPLRYIVEQIAGDDFEVFTVVPDGSSAEMYEPTPSVLKNVSRSKAFISVGMLETEINVINYISKDSSIINYTLNKDVSLLQGDCTHGDEHGHNHSHSAEDPHIWLGISNTQKIAASVLNILKTLNPDSLAKYESNYKTFSDSVASLKNYADSKREAMEGKTIIVYHPFLGYLANEYGFEQLSIEQNGKEPSAKALKNLVKTAREKAIDKIFYQSQFSKSSIESLSKELGAQKIEINPLSYEHINNMRNIIEQISR